MKRSLPFIWLAVGVAVALGLGWAARMRDGGSGAESSNRAGGAALGDDNAHSKAGHPAPGVLQRLAGEQRSAATQRSVRQPIEQPSTADQAVVTQANAAGQVPLDNQAEPNPTDADATQASDASVVGRAFPVSASILAECKSTLETRPWRSCEPNKKLLDAMAEEPRDELWASSAEHAIRAFVEQEPGEFTIRSLECRRSICFVEVASIMRGFHVALYHFEKNGGLQAGYPIHGSETDEFGSTLHITLYPFVKK